MLQHSTTPKWGPQASRTSTTWESVRNVDSSPDLLNLNLTSTETQGSLGQRSLACCSPWGSKESDMTEWLNGIELNLGKMFNCSMSQFTHLFNGHDSIHFSKLEEVKSVVFRMAILNILYLIVHEVAQSLNRVRLFVTPWTAALQAPPSMEFSRQEHWSGLLFHKWK